MKTKGLLFHVQTSYVTVPASKFYERENLVAFPSYRIGS